MNFIKCVECGAEFATYRELADHSFDHHRETEIVIAQPINQPPGPDPKVPYQLNENDKAMLKKLYISQDE